MNDKSGSTNENNLNRWKEPRVSKQSERKEPRDKKALINKRATLKINME